MKIFVVYWHPEPRSFNAAMLETICSTLCSLGHEVRVSNLHRMNFDPVSSRRNFLTVKEPGYFKPQAEEQFATERNGFADEVECEIKNVEWCDLMIWQFPLWWFGLPAVLKGWVDRVFAAGRIHGNGRYYDTGVFRGKRAALSLTTGSAETAFRPGGLNGDIAGILRPIHRGMLQFVGFDVLSPHVVYAPARLTDEQRATELEALSRRLRGIGCESPIEVGAY
jgi:NAD(P)H dehydrogenase (quinone)